MELLVTHEIDWNRRDQYCAGQFADPNMPEELPTAPINAGAQLLVSPKPFELGFDKFDFDGEDPVYD